MKTDLRISVNAQLAARRTRPPLPGRAAPPAVPRPPRSSFDAVVTNRQGRGTEASDSPACHLLIFGQAQGTLKRRGPYPVSCGRLLVRGLGKQVRAQKSPPPTRGLTPPPWRLLGSPFLSGFPWWGLRRKAGALCLPCRVFAPAGQTQSNPLAPQIPTGLKPQLNVDLAHA